MASYIDRGKRPSFKSLVKSANELPGMTSWRSDGVKSAQMVQNPDDTQFEQDFAKLAYMFVQERAGLLMPYILGFEVVNRSEDGSRGIGIFGFKVGKEYYYVPAFFLGNQVKGVDSIFKKSDNSFFPLTEEWIDNILNRHAIELGNPAANSEDAETDAETPNFDFLRRPTIGPLGGPKYASAELAKVSPGNLAAVGRAMMASVKEAATKDPAFAESWRGFVEACMGHEPELEKHASASVSKYLSEVGGPMATASLLNTFCKTAADASTLLAFYPDVKSVAPESYADHGVVASRSQHAKVTPSVVFRKTAADEESAREILARGFSVSDGRSESEVSEAYDLETAMAFGNPDGSGNYNCLSPTGSVNAYTVVYPRDRQDGVYVLGEEKDGRRGSAARTVNEIITVGEMLKGGRDIAADMPSVSSMSAPGEGEYGGNRYLLVDTLGRHAGVFSVSSDMSEDGAKRYRGWLDRESGCSSFDSSDPTTWKNNTSGLDASPCTCSPTTSCVNLVVSDNATDASVVGDTMVVPSSWHAVKLGPEYDSGDKAPPKPLLASNLTDALLHCDMHSVRITADTTGTTKYHVSADGGYPSEEMGEKDAEACLMTRLMMSKADAERLMAKAAESGEAWAVLKFPEFATAEKRAQMQGVGVSMGMPTPQTPEADPYTGIPVYGVPYQEEIGGQFTNVPAMRDPNAQGINIGGELQQESGQAGPGTPGGDAENAPPIPEEERQLAEQAAALGQRNVFDHAAIGGLSKVYDTNAVIDSYLPEFMDTIDRLGRVLFLYYWKHDDFMERYGSGDTVEMEDLLRSTYKQLGKLTLKLRERAIGREDAESAQL